MADPQSDLTVLHTIWLAATTIGGAIVAFFTKRLVDQVDTKADQADVDALRNDFQQMLARQDRQHQGNTDRLDRIIMELGRGDR